MRAIRNLLALLMVLAVAGLCPSKPPQSSLGQARASFRKRPPQSSLRDTAPVWVITDTAVPKTCPCSSECTCGCNQGRPCTCGQAVPAAPAPAPAYEEPGVPAFRLPRQGARPSVRGSCST